MMTSEEIDKTISTILASLADRLKTPNNSTSGNTLVSMANVVKNIEDKIPEFIHNFYKEEEIKLAEYEEELAFDKEWFRYRCDKAGTFMDFVIGRAIYGKDTNVIYDSRFVNMTNVSDIRHRSGIRPNIDRANVEIYVEAGGTIVAGNKITNIRRSQFSSLSLSTMSYSHPEWDMEESRATGRIHIGSIKRAVPATSDQIILSGYESCLCVPCGLGNHIHEKIKRALGKGSS